MPIADNRPGAISTSGDVVSINGQSGVVVLTKANIGLANVDNTSDVNKPVSTLQQAALDDKIGLNDPPKEIEPDDSGAEVYAGFNYEFKPLQASPNEVWNLNSYQINVDPDLTGFEMGSNGQFANLFNLGISHLGSANIGNFSYINTYLNIGNGVDPLSVSGLHLMTGFGNINKDVTIAGSIQGYGFQFTGDAEAIIDGYINGFFDYCNFAGTVNNFYTSFAAGPTVNEMANNTSMTSFNINPTINNLAGNAGYNGIILTGNFGNFGTGGYTGIYINPTVASIDYAVGLNVDMSNVTSINKWAAQFNGNVSINGSLSFTGALSIGSLNAYSELNPVIDGGGIPTTIHSLITGIVAPDNVTIANVDTIGVNTATLITIGENANLTSGAFKLGLSALALPAVVNTKTGSFVDRITAATYALSFDMGSTGGVVEEAIGCRTVFIPNGITTIDRSYGFYFDLPFGPVGTDSWGLYIQDAPENFIEGALKLGGADKVLVGEKLHVEGNTFIEGELSLESATVECNDNAIETISIGNISTNERYVLDYILKLNVSGKKRIGKIELAWDVDEGAVIFDEEYSHVGADIDGVEISGNENAGSLRILVDLDAVGENTKFKYSVTKIKQIT